MCSMKKCFLKSECKKKKVLFASDFTIQVYIFSNISIFEEKTFCYNLLSNLWQSIISLSYTSDCIAFHNTVVDIDFQYKTKGDVVSPYVIFAKWQSREHIVFPILERYILYIICSKFWAKIYEKRFLFYYSRPLLSNYRHNICLNLVKCLESKETLVP